MSRFKNTGPRRGALLAVAVAAVSLGFVRSDPAPASPGAASTSKARVSAASDVEAGRYLVRVGGCNDCHTPGYMEHGTGVPEEQWLVGSPVGWRGPWGTTYPTNLRRFVQETPLDVWLAICAERTTRPPMPWPNLHAMSDEDRTAIYRYIEHLGPAGEPAPAYCDPGVEPRTPFFLLDPDEVGFRQVYAAAPPAKLCDRRDVETFELMGLSVRVLIPSGDTRDAYSQIELSVPAGAGTPLHVQRAHDKVIQVVEGQLEVRLGHETMRVGHGERVVVPRTTLHSFRNAAEAPARVHVTTSPGGHDEFLSRLAELGQDCTPQEHAELCATYGVELLGS